MKPLTKLTLAVAVLLLAGLGYWAAQVSKEGGPRVAEQTVTGTADDLAKDWEWLNAVREMRKTPDKAPVVAKGGEKVMGKIYGVAGCGDADFISNNYVQDGVDDVYGYPLYRLDATHVMFFCSSADVESAWVLYDGDPGTTAVEFCEYVGGTNPLDPTDGAWTVGTGTAPAPTVTLISDDADTTAPTRQSAAVNAAGTKVIVTYDEALDDSNTPTGHSVKVNGEAAAIASAAIVGATVELTMSDTIYKPAVDTVTESYAPGNVTDEAGNALAAYSDQAVTNNSTQEIPVTTLDFTIDAGVTKDLPTPHSASDDVAVTRLARGGVTENLNIITAAVDGDTVADIDTGTTSDKGLMAVLQVVKATGDNATAAPIIQHAPDSSGEPGTWATLLSFDAVTNADHETAQVKEVAPGTTIYPHLRFSVPDGADGNFVFAVGVARRF